MPQMSRNRRILSTPANKSTPARMRIFLEAYAKTGRVNRACEAAHITPRDALQKAESDPVYRRAFEQAAEQVGQMLEDAAVDGRWKGNHLLLALLKGSGRTPTASGSRRISPSAWWTA